VPELPEVETARKVIAERALHRTIVAVDDTDSYVCRPHAPGQIRDALLGRQLIAAHRRGKTMWCETSGLDGSAEHGSAEHGSAEHGPDLGLHLGMAGRIVVESPGLETVWGGEPFRRDAQPARAQWDRFRLDFADGGSLVLFDKRRLSRVRLNPGLAALGPDAGTVTEAEFRDLVRRGTVAVKARLLDQSKLAGVGNLLADEALWQARISPQAPAGSLSRPAASRCSLGPVAGPNLAASRPTSASASWQTVPIPSSSSLWAVLVPTPHNASTGSSPSSSNQVAPVIRNTPAGLP